LVLSRSLSLLLTLAVAPGGCTRDDARADVPRNGAVSELGQQVTWERSIALQENQAVVNVLIRVSASPDQFLISDEQEDQIRRYDRSGRLLAAFGRRGNGPGEFTYLTNASRTPSGAVVAVDALSRGALFDSTGKVLRTFRVPVAPVKFATVVDDTLLLLGGTVPPGSGVDPDARLHLWNLRTNRLARSFFEVRPRPRPSASRRTPQACSARMCATTPSRRSSPFPTRSTCSTWRGGHSVTFRSLRAGCAGSIPPCACPEWTC
jgi:hypothetical protein